MNQTDTILNKSQRWCPLASVGEWCVENGRENHREAPETGRLRSRSPLQLLGGQGDSRLFCSHSFYFCCAPPAQKQTAHALRTRAACASSFLTSHE